MRTLYFKTLARVRDQWSRRRIAHDTERMLRTLDTRTLRDIGLHRSEIPSVAHEVARASEPTRTLVALSRTY